ncbi:hypothetical protein Rsub_08603 [Raphidocelis subcapitata]|uniref:peptidylprolyl isomerase n=1 Tax=Raphidocelis subcapitata TaxID=307507 RepID=A0A2V0P6X7_9CHLO|nr:hypothetical protein Rsub_08603 [Raphidocelis subcapitata]|eukprot:GBF95621.1 hypothetical protein Rsub_08603 [Raphidocelis subcapitata]
MQVSSHSLSGCVAAPVQARRHVGGLRTPAAAARGAAAAATGHAAAPCEDAAAAGCSRRDALLRLAGAPALAAALAQQLAAPLPARAEGAPRGAPSLAPPGSVAPEERITLATNEEAAGKLTPSDKQVLALNRRVQAQNRAPEDFPGFVRQGFDILIVADGYGETPNGLLYRDYKVGSGEPPQEGQQVVFDYTGYNESGAAIDSSYRQGRPAETRLGIAGLIPGFEEGIRTMRVGGKRRIIVPPKLGPPIGPSTFFSAKQCEVFDIELRAMRTCRQEQVMMFSRVVCE